MAIAVVCESCDRSVTVKDDLAGRKIKCPGCGKVLTVPDEEVEEPENEEERPGKRSGGKDRGDRESGQTICRAFNIFDQLQNGVIVFVGGAMVVGGIIALYMGLAGKAKDKLQSVGGIVGGPVIAVGGVALGIWGALRAWRTLERYRAKERFLLGKDKLLWVIGEDEVLGQIPYDNIDTIRVRNIGSFENPQLVVGLRFLDSRRRDTFIKDDERRDEWESAGFDYAIWDLYETGVHAFAKILKKARNQTRGDSE